MHLSAARPSRQSKRFSKPFLAAVIITPLWAICFSAQAQQAAQAADPSSDTAQQSPDDSEQQEEQSTLVCPEDLLPEPAGMFAWIMDKLGFGDDDAEEDGGETVSAKTFPYAVCFEGLGSGKTLDLVQQVSDTLRLKSDPPLSYSRLRARAEGDLPNIMKALRARAYYAATVDLDIDRTTSPTTIKFLIEVGPSYDIQEVAIELDPPSEDELTLPSAKKLGLEKNKRAASTKIIEAETALLSRAKNQGFANAKLGKRRVVVDHDNATMDITLRLNPGRKIYFGDTEISGNVEVETRYIRRLLAWKPGKLITPERLEETRLNLVQSGLFNSVRIEPETEVDDQGRALVRIDVNETKHRSIEAGVRYRTDEGLGGNLGWEHRNLLGTGEQLSADLDASKLGWTLKGEAREPDFLAKRQALVIGSEIAVEKTEAFDKQSIGASVGIERSVGDGMDLAVGLAFTASKVEQDGDTDKFGLLSLPTSFGWDHSNDLLDPSKGGRLFISNEPFVDVFGNDVAFNKSLISYSRYFRLKKNKPRLILATRAKAGFLFGAERDNVPADERFYAGGGGSVRGFGFQLAGDLDDDNNPVGGRSLLEFAGELRGQFTDSLGAAIFADAGTAYNSSVPDFEEPLRIGVGGGLRYFSPVGPIRFDVGVPLNRRDSDDAFQIYISIGQAF